MDERWRAHRVAFNRRAAAPVDEAIRAAGFPVETFSDLRGQRMDYRAAVPILLEWLPRIDNVDVKEEIVRALTVKWAKPAAAAPLVEEFRRADDAALRWAIGNALEVVGDDSIREDLLGFAVDQRYGSARQMVIMGLGKMKHDRDRVVEVLIGLLDDEEVAGHVLIALRRLRATEARSHIEPFLDHQRTWVRNEAKKALARFDR